jgi:hypothetical protein
MNAFISSCALQISKLFEISELCYLLVLLRTLLK